MANRRILMEERRSGGKVLPFLLGLLFGIITALGSLVGVGYYLYNSPIKTTLDLVDKNGTAYEVLFDETSGYLNPKYAEEQVGVLLTDAIAAFVAVGQGGPMREAQEVSPLFSGLFTSLLEVLQSYEVPVTEDELLDQSLNGIFPYIVDALGETPVGGFLKGSSGAEITDPLMLAICYGPESHYHFDESGNVVMNPVTYELRNGKLYDVEGELVAGTYEPTAKTLTLGDGTVYYLEPGADPSNVFNAYVDAEKTQPLLYHKTLMKELADNDELIDYVYISDVMTVDTSSSLMMYLAYGKAGVHYQVDAQGNVVLDAETNEPVLLQKQLLISGDEVYNEYGELLATTHTVSGNTITYVSDGETYSYQFTDGGTREWKRKNAATNTAETKTGRIYLLSDTNGKALYYKPATLKDLASEDNALSKATSRLTLSEFLDVESNRFLKHLENETIELLPYAIEELTLTQVYADQIYYTNETGEFTDEYGVVVGEENKVIRPAWWYLMHDEPACEAGREDENSPHYGHTTACDCIEDYTVNDMNRLIENMNANINIVTLGKLKSDGMIETDVDLTNTKVTFNALTDEQVQKLQESNIQEGTALEDLTVDQAMTYISIVITTLDKLQNDLTSEASSSIESSASAEASSGEDDSVGSQESATE